jgi:hypothetical protein
MNKKVDAKITRTNRIEARLATGFLGIDLLRMFIT